MNLQLLSQEVIATKKNYEEALRLDHWNDKVDELDRLSQVTLGMMKVLLPIALYNENDAIHDFHAEVTQLHLKIQDKLGEIIFDLDVKEV